jgi:hypothetical protein
MGLVGSSANLASSGEALSSSVVFLSITVDNAVFCSSSERLLLGVLPSDSPSSMMH